MNYYQEANQQNPNPGPSSMIPQSNLSTQDLFSFLRNEENSSSAPSFFSKMGLSKDILKVTDAEPDICLEAFYALYHTLLPQIDNLRESERLRDDSRLIISMSEAWLNFIGSAMHKGILCPPEKLLSKRRPKDIKKLLSQSEGEDQIFRDFDQVQKSISNLKEIVDFPDDLFQREEIMASLDLIEEFYKGYRSQVKRLIESILEKEEMNVACVSEYETFLDLLEPKAVMIGDIFNNHWAYRIPREKAQILLSIDENGRSTRNYLNSESNCPAALPEGPEPLVYFKVNEYALIRPEKEFMLYSLYRQLKIPVPETALLILTDVFQESSDQYYAVQASEAVSGKSALEACQDQETIFEEKAYVEQVIGALLTNPVDGSFRNFKYNPEYKTLIGVDNNSVFKLEFRGENGDEINVKSALYLLPQMDLPIPESIKTVFTSLDLHLTIFTWLQDLFQKNKQYNLLFARLSFQKTRHVYQNLRYHSETPSLKSCVQKTVHVDPHLHDHSFYPQILLSKTLLTGLAEKLQIIERTLLNLHQVTPQILFEEVSPILGKYYRKLRIQFSDPQEALEALWGEKKNDIDYSYASSLLDHEELENLLRNRQDSEKLFPETLLPEYKKLLSGESPIDQFIKRHTQRKKRNLLNLIEVLEELKLLVQEDLTSSQSIQDIVDFWHSISRKSDSETDGHLIKEITLLLSSVSNAELQWLMTLEKYFVRAVNGVPEDSKPSSMRIIGAFMKQRTFILSESEKLAIFDQQGKIKKSPSLTGRSNVTFFPQENPEFYLKQYPEFPGYEFASTLFMRLLGIEHLPYHDLILIENSYPALISQKVNGSPVHKIWGNSQVFDKLDPVHTVLLIIAAMLINPEDGKEDNFILSPDEKFLIPIDNDHYFLPSTFQKKGDFWNLFAVNTALQTKTLLFCLDEMKKPIPSEVKRHIISKDFDLLLTSWMNELINVQDKYNNFIREDQRKRFFENGTIINILFYDQFISHMHWKAHKIKEMLAKDSDLTPFDLLKAVEPFAAKCYEDSFQPESKLQSRFKAATNQLYTKPPENGSRVSVFNTRAFMEVIHITEKDLQNDAILQRMGPVETLNLLKQLTQEHSEKIQKERALLCELDDKNHEKKWINLFGKPLMEMTLKDFFANPKEGLVLKGSKLVTTVKLKELFAQTLHQGMKIRFLSLVESPLLTDKEIRILVKECPNLEYLNLSGCVKLNEIVTAKGEWLLLARLEAKDCLSLKKVVSYSPLKILRIGTYKRIEVFVEKPTLDLFSISADLDLKEEKFELILRRGENFEMRFGNRSISDKEFFLDEGVMQEIMSDCFRSWKLVIGDHLNQSNRGPRGFITSLNLENKKIGNPERELENFDIKRLVQFGLFNLKNLDLSGNKIGDIGIQILSQGNWPFLKMLNLKGTGITKRGFLQYISSANWPELHKIDSDFENNFASNLSPKNLFRLEDLDLSDSAITKDEIEIIVNRYNWRFLKHLNLSLNSEINDEELETLSQGRWPELETLNLKATGITKQSFSNFLLNANWPSFKEITLPECCDDLDRNLVLSFIKKDLSQVKKLEFSNSKIVVDEVSGIESKTKYWIPSERKIKLLASLKCPLLEELHLESTELRSGGVYTIARQSNWPNLKCLNLSNNALLDQGISFLARAKWPLLEELYLKNTKITLKAIEIIINDLEVLNLKTIDVSKNRISEEGLKVLASASRKWPSLKCLN